MPRTHYQPKNILITGAAGFIGCNFVQFLFQHHEDINVISFDKLTYAGSEANLASVQTNPRHTFVRGDIGDQEKVAATLRQFEIDTVVHFAAESHVDNSIDNPAIFLQTNILGTQMLLEAVKQFWLEEKQWDSSQCRFHHISTDEVYGSLNSTQSPFTEEKRYEPNSPYAASKAGSDHIVRAYHHTYGLPVTTSNCSNNYGPYQHAEKFIPVVIRSCMNQTPIPVYGDGSNIRDWLYVEDHCEAIDRILQEGKIGEVYNIGGNCELNNLALVEKICALMDKYKPNHAPHVNLIEFVEDRKGHDWRYAIDSTKIEKELNWKPSQDFEAMLNKTVEFYIRST